MVSFLGVGFVQNQNLPVYILEFTGTHFTSGGTSGGTSGLLKSNFSYYNWIYGVTRYTRSMEYKIEKDQDSGNFIVDTFNTIKDAITGNSAGTDSCNITGLLFTLFMILFH